jgi:hypothetical protein
MQRTTARSPPRTALDRCRLRRRLAALRLGPWGAAARLGRVLPAGHEQAGLRPAVAVGLPPPPVSYPVLLVVPLTTQHGTSTEANPRGVSAATCRNRMVARAVGDAVRPDADLRRPPRPGLPRHARPGQLRGGAAGCPARAGSTIRSLAPGADLPFAKHGLPPWSMCRPGGAGNRRARPARAERSAPSTTGTVPAVWSFRPGQCPRTVCVHAGSDVERGPRPPTPAAGPLAADESRHAQGEPENTSCVG